MTGRITGDPTPLYPTVTLMLIDSEGRVIENKHLTTAWVEPEEAS